jgi:hypothetical protein
MPNPVDIPEFAPTDDLMPALLAFFHADLEGLDRHFVLRYSPRRRKRIAEFVATWRDAIAKLDFDALTPSDKADRRLFINHLDEHEREHDEAARLFSEMEPLVPFAQDLIALEDARRQVEFIEPEAAAEALHRALAELKETKKAFENEAGDKPRPAVAHRAGRMLEDLRKALEDWFGFYNGYDPLFSWWAQAPYKALDEAVKAYATYLKEKIAGAEDPDAIIGDPAGRDALVDQLKHALIPYSPEELLAIGRKEMEWCRAEMLKASADMGLGDDWRAAIERTKQDHVPPGEQARFVRDLAVEAIEFLEAHDLVGVPPYARTGWRMDMMSPEDQKVSPFFLGGPKIIVSFPTDAMEHERKLMSMRGNNRGFSRATVQHELIPGHYLQSYAQERYRPYRRLFYTPFWTEGWALHWEMVLWEEGFPQTPEQRVGMLFWRMHRCARIVFSLGFHLGEMTPQECIDMLVDEVGHERENAAAEVRRSFLGDYPPLYQLAYLIGGLQVHALRNELVESGRMSQRKFHDAFLQENNMPIAVVRELLCGRPVGRDGVADWRFYEGL